MVTTVFDWDATDPAENANVPGIPWYEGMQPSQINDAGRNMMAQIAAALQTMVTPLMYQAIGDGVTDDTVALQEMLDSGKDIYIPSGTFLISETLELSTAYQKLFMSPSAKILADDSFNNYMLTITEDYVLVEGGTLDGNRATVGVGASGGIKIDDNQGCRIQGVRIQQAKGFGIYVEGSKRTRLVGNWISDTSDWGIKFDDSAVIEYNGDALISLNLIDRQNEGVGIVGGGIYVRGNDSAGQVRTIINANSIYLSQNPVEVTAAGIRVERVFHSNIGNNVCTLGRTSIYAADCQVLAITGNTAHLASAQGIGLEDCSNVTVTGNAVNGGSATPYGVYLQDTGSCSVVGNTVDACVTAGLQIAGTHAGTIDYINFTGNTLRSVGTLIASSLAGTSALGSNIAARANPGVRDYLDFKNNIIDMFGTGTPEAVVAAGIGSVFHRTDGAATTSIYIKTSGTGNTGWTAK